MVVKLVSSGSEARVFASGYSYKLKINVLNTLHQRGCGIGARSLARTPRSPGSNPSILVNFNSNISDRINSVKALQALEPPQPHFLKIFYKIIIYLPMQLVVECPYGPFVMPSYAYVPRKTINELNPIQISRDLYSKNHQNQTEKWIKYL